MLTTARGLPVAAYTPVHTVDLVLTSRCNLRCAYCFENARSGASMRWEVAQAALDAALASTGRAVRVVFFGGEPTLEFATIRRAVAYAEARRASHRIRFELVTNGTLLGGDEIAFLSSHRVATQISLDGTPEAQGLRGSGTFAKLDGLLETLRARHRAYFERSVSVAMTLSPGTIPYFAPAIDYFHRKDVREIGVAIDMLGDREWTEAMEGDLDRSFADVARSARDHDRRTGRVPLRLFRKEGPRPRRAVGPVPMCSVADGGRFAVDADGSLLICAVLARSIQRFQPTHLGSLLDGVDLGDVREPALAARVAVIPEVARLLRIFHDKQEKHSSHGRCADCRYLRSCGLCPASIAQIPGNDDPDRIPDFACAFNRIWLKHRNRFPVMRPPVGGMETRSRRSSHRLRSMTRG